MPARLFQYEQPEIIGFGIVADGEVDVPHDAYIDLVVSDVSGNAFVGDEAVAIAKLPGLSGSESDEKRLALCLAQEGGIRFAAPVGRRIRGASARMGSRPRGFEPAWGVAQRNGPARFVAGPFGVASDAERAGFEPAVRV